ncbi:MAG: diacylglycerol/lipid kinase family protein [Parahaliea sp.]
MQASVFFIYNVTAGLVNERQIDSYIEALTTAGYIVTTLLTGPGTASYHHHFHRMSRDVGASIVIAGGDGTVRHVLQELADLPCRVAVLPLGTANVLAQELASPSTPQGLLKLLAEGKERPLNLIKAGDKSFAAVASVGFDATVVRDVSISLKAKMGKFAYVWASLKKLCVFRPQTFTVELNGAAYKAESILLINGRYYAGRMLAVPDGSIEQPSLSVLLLRIRSRLDFLRYTVLLVFARLHRARGVTCFSTRQVSVSTQGQPVQLDGDYCGKSPIRFTCAPTGNIRVLSTHFANKS